MVVMAASSTFVDHTMWAKFLNQPQLVVLLFGPTLELLLQILALSSGVTPTLMIDTKQIS